ncbi:hypothetical protein DYB26_003625, partial [Aphanomyces astaci]
MASTGGIQYLITTVAAAALRLFDASVAVATFNLFSDEPIALTRKVRDSMQLMQSFNVSLELPHHCHHTILAGGFHFGVGKIPHQTLVNRIETAYLAQGTGSCRGCATTTGRCHVPVCPEYSSIIDDYDDDHDDMDDVVVDVMYDVDSFWNVHLPPSSQIKISHKPRAKKTKSWCAYLVDAAEGAEIAWLDVVECDNLQRLMDSND